MNALPPALPGTSLRVLATTDLGAVVVPLRTSFGESGTCAGMVELVEAESARQPTVWLDVGDLVVGPLGPLLGTRPWDEIASLPISAAAAGNHEFDDGVAELLRAADRLTFPVLCANIDIGLPATTVVDTEVGPLGVIGLTHPHSHRFSRAPRPREEWRAQVGQLARDLRSNGARWVIALLHDGVDWWPNPTPHTGPPTLSRADRLQTTTAPWADQVDLILGGHTPAAWIGDLSGTPAGHPHIWATSTLVVDLPDPPGQATVRGVFRVPPRRPPGSTRAVEVCDAAAARIVAESRHDWLTRTGAKHYLPDVIAAALRGDTGADAAFVPPSKHGTQAPLDGAIAAVRTGPVSELDLMRLFPSDDDHAVVVELAGQEWQILTSAYAAAAAPDARSADSLWWNWCRMPAGISAHIERPTTVAVMPSVVRMLSEWLDRDLNAQPAGAGARAAMTRVLS